MPLEPVDSEVAEYFNHYQYAKVFGRCSKAEYEAMPHKETQWLLQMDNAFNVAQNDANEKAAKDSNR